MQFSDIAKHRLNNQKIAESSFTSPQEVVGYMAAMQAQEYAMARWAIGLRLPSSLDSEIENAFNNGEILRTHLLRPTWHFVAPKDIRWMLKLTAPRIHAINAFMIRKTELDPKIFNLSNNFICRALEGKKQLTRNEISAELERNKIKADGVRLSLIMMHAELEGLICSGARKGKQFTYALIDEIVPQTKVLTEDEALAELAERYFTSRGPATVQDFATWSGLNLTSSKKAVNFIKDDFISETINDKEYIFPQKEVKSLGKLQAGFLMPDYDEYGIGYKDRSAVLMSKKERPVNPRDNFIFNRMIAVDGQLIGSWHRTIGSDKLTINTTPFTNFNKNDVSKIKTAAKEYARFLGFESNQVHLPDLD